MRKLKVYAPPIIIIAVSIAVMLSGGFLKRPFSSNDDVIKYVYELRSNIKSSNWAEAQSNLKSLENAWTKVEKRIQFSVERDDMNKLTVALSRIQGAIEAKNKDSALVELYEVLEHWEHLEL